MYNVYGIRCNLQFIYRMYKYVLQYISIYYTYESMDVHTNKDMHIYIDIDNEGVLSNQDFYGVEDLQ
jgi:hypothetical protein